MRGSVTLTSNESMTLTLKSWCGGEAAASDRECGNCHRRERSEYCGNHHDMNVVVVFYPCPGRRMMMRNRIGGDVSVIGIEIVIVNGSVNDCEIGSERKYGKNETG